jgi:hypothetical protein
MSNRFAGGAVAEANRRALVNQERAAGQRDASQIKTLTDKEEALLASIRSQLLGGGKGKGTKSGGGGSGSHQGSRKGKPGMGGSTLGSGKDKAKPVNTVDGVRRYDDLDDLEDDEDEEGGAGDDVDDDDDDDDDDVDGVGDAKKANASRRETVSAPPPTTQTKEKLFMSKAERKRLKKTRLGGVKNDSGRPGNVSGAGPAGTSAVPANMAEKERKKADDEDVKKQRAPPPPQQQQKKKQKNNARKGEPSRPWPPRREAES